MSAFMRLTLPGTMMVVILMVMVAMTMTMMAMVMTAARQQQGARQIDPQAEDGDQGGLSEGDGAGVEQPGDGLAGDAQRHDAEDQRRGETGQIADLAGPETEPPVGGSYGDCKARACEVNRLA